MINNKYPNISPSLNLDFTNSNTIDPRITFGRASAATYYDGKTVAKAEENLLVRSQEFDHAAWSASSAVPTITANAAAAPDGTSTAHRIVFPAADSRWRQGLALTSGTAYTISIYARSNTGGDQTFRLWGQDAAFNSADLTATTSWQRFTYTFTASSSATFAMGIRTSVANAAADLLIWGMQVEARSTVTAYTPTTTQPITNYIPVLQTALSGVPRIDHDPVTGECKGLLIEEQRTNLLTYSEQFDNSTHWRLASVSVIANLSVDPSGSLGGDYIRESLDAVATTHEIARQTLVEFTSGVAYTYSVFAKAGPNSRLLRMSFPSAAFAGEPTVYFNLVAGTTSGVSGASIASTGNGWWKCSFTQVATATTGSIYLGLGVAATSGAKNYTGDGYSGIYIWGAQLETGSFPTSYIKTEASQVTRAVDSARLVGTNLSSWYRPDSGTFLMSLDYLGVGLLNKNQGVLGQASSLKTLAYTNVGEGGVLVAYTGTSNVNVGSTNAGNSFLAVGYDTTPSSTTLYSAKDSVIRANGTNVTGGLQLTDILLGSRLGNVAGALCFKRLTYYPKRLPAAQLQALTA